MKNEIMVKGSQRLAEMLPLMSLDSLDVIKGLVQAQNLTEAEFNQFIVQCKRTGLDPVTRQIYAVKQSGRMSVMTSIDGFRLIAERSGMYAGQDGPYWCDEDGKWVDIWLKKTPPAAAKVGVLKKGFDKPLYAVALFNEYAKRAAYDNKEKGVKKGDLEFMWAKMPALMIAKVAESLALRKAFPNDMSGIYTREEFSPESDKDDSDKDSDETNKALKGEIKAPVQVQAKPQAEPQKPEYEAFNQLASEVSQEQPQTVEDLGEFVMPIGKEHKGKKLKEISISKLEGFTTWLQQKNAEKPLTGEVLTTLNILESYISQLKYLPEA